MRFHGSISVAVLSLLGFSAVFAGPTPAGAERISVAVGDLEFTVRVAGPVEGEPVLLLHGFPQTSHAFRHQLEALAEAGYRAVAPDQRGYSPGARPDDVSAYRMRELVGDVLGIADRLGFESFHLVGHDWGGAVAWVLASTAPDRLRSLSVLSTPHVSAFGRALANDAEQAERSSYFGDLSAPGAELRLLADDARLLRGFLSGLEPDAIDVYVAALDDPAALAAALAWYRASGLASAASAGGGRAAPLWIDVPTLYVWGTEDRAFGRSAAEATAEFVRGPYRFVPLEGRGHWLMEQATATVSRLLIEHMSRR